MSSSLAEAWRRRPRRRRPGSLQLCEREEISRGLAAGKTLRDIAAELGRAPSTISREIRRNQSQRGYRAHRAEYRAQRRARRPKPCLLERHERLREVVIEKLQCNWSPRQISGYLIEQFPDEPSMRVSPETIYRSLFIQARGVLKKDLIKHLRTGRRIRRAKAASARLIPAHGQILDAVRISQRPAEVEDRAVPGHWEGDLLVGSKHTKIATLVERQSRFVMLVKMPADDSKSIVDALARTVQKLPAELRRSLTWDRGSEMASAQTLHGGDGRASLLLRSAQSLAARQQREHEWTAATVLPKGNGSVPLLPASPGQGRP